MVGVVRKYVEHKHFETTVCLLLGLELEYFTTAYLVEESQSNSERGRRFRRRPVYATVSKPKADETGQGEI